MPRSRSTTSRRPKGKRGWRQIQFDFEKVESANDDHARPSSASSRNAPALFHIDKRPRRQTREEIKKAAREALLAQGYSVHTVKQLEEISLKKRREESRRRNKKNGRQLVVNGEHVNSMTRPKKLPPKKPRKFFKREQSIRDVWGSHSSRRRNEEDKGSFAGAAQAHLADRCERTSFGVVKNVWVPPNVGISLPHPGQSVNPDTRERAHLQSIRAQQLIKTQQSDAKDMMWSSQRAGSDKDAAKQRNHAESLEFSIKRLKKIVKKYPIYRIRTKKGLGPRRSVIRSSSLYGLQSKFTAPLPKGLRWKFTNKKKTSMRNCSRQLHNPISMLYSNLQRQRRVRGVRFTTPARPNNPYFGPRFRTATRIGKVHHNFALARLFKGIDD